jgi:hypothetical protein
MHLYACVYLNIIFDYKLVLLVTWYWLEFLCITIGMCISRQLLAQVHACFLSLVMSPTLS